MASLEDLEWLPEQEATVGEVPVLRELFPKDRVGGRSRNDNDWGGRAFGIRMNRGLDYPVDTIDFRYSPTGDPVETLEAFVTAAKVENCLLFSHELCTWFEPELKFVCDKLEMSRAFRFTQDPSRALAERAAKQDGV